MICISDSKTAPKYFMAQKQRRGKEKAKICTENIQQILFSADDRENYLKVQGKRKILERRKKKQQEQEEKKEQLKQKKKEHKRRQQENADLAQRVIDAQKMKEESIELGDSIVTIREI